VVKSKRKSQATAASVDFLFGLTAPKGPVGMPTARSRDLSKNHNFIANGSVGRYYDPEVGRRGYFSTENYFLDAGDEPALIISAGGRYGNKVTLDYGGMHYNQKNTNQKILTNE
jgi:hypothetical protein